MFQVAEPTVALTDARDPRRGVKEILTSKVAPACCYAFRPDERPDCRHLGVKRYGPIALCSDCDRRRSAVGKGMTPVVLPDPAALLELLAAQDACIQAEGDLRRAVAAARAANQSWSAIGILLGTTRQAAQQRFATVPRRPRSPAEGRTPREENAHPALT